MEAELPVFTQEEMAIDEAQGFPKAYALLCKNSATISPFARGPPLSFIPYALQSQEALRVNELNQMFPIIDPEVCSSANLRSYANFLWEQLDHLGNAGLDPALFRVDRFGNVVYRNADSASPLAWDIDHWFPRSRGGKTVPSNLKIVQLQVCKKKNNRLDFLIPWWDLQLGISVSQFLSIFTSKNSDFRSRAFSFIFPDGGGEELNCLQNLHLQSSPQSFMDAKRKQGLALATMVSSQTKSDTTVLKAIDLNRSLRQNSPFPASMKSFHKAEDVANQELLKLRSSFSKENNQPVVDDHGKNSYQTISQARDSLRQSKEARKLRAEISQLVEELNELKQKNDLERIALQELEAELIGKRRRVENCRQLSEAQASYRSLLEKMIRDAMHQTVVYKEQLRLNQAASNTLMARLKTQRAACDASEYELRRKNKKRDELEKQVMGCSEQALKSSQIYDDGGHACDGSEYELRRKYKQRDELKIKAMACSEKAPKSSQIYADCHENSSHLSSTRRVRRPTKKELRVFLEEEQKASEAGISLSFDDQEEMEESEKEDHCQPSKANKIKDDIFLNSKLKGIAMGEESYKRTNDQKKQISYPYNSLYNFEEEKGTIFVSKDEDLTANRKLKQIQHKELNVMKTNESCKKIHDPKMQKSYPCSSSYNIEGHEAILVSNKLKKLQKRGLEMNESQKQWDPSSLELQEKNEEYRNQVGKGNVEKWLQILLENAKDGSTNSDSHTTLRNFDERTINTNTEIKQNEIELCRTDNAREKQRSDKMDSEKRFKEKKSVGTTSSSTMKVASRSKKSCEVEDKEESKAGLPKGETSRGFISFPSSPSVILGMRKSVEWMRRKPRSKKSSV